MTGPLIRRLSPDDGHYFFGYYDHSDISPDGRYMLSHRSDFHHRPPKKGEAADIILLDRQRGDGRPVAKTLAWNFQQGSMLQWLGKDSLHFIYNQWQNAAYCAVIQSIEGDVRSLPRPITALSADGSHALSASFTRMRDFRPVCGYAFGEDEFSLQNSPNDDGVFLMNIESGETELVLSYAQMLELTGEPIIGEQAKLCVNHLSYNTSGKRFLCLVRNFPTQGRHWQSALITANIDGTEPFLLLGWSYASHYNWKDEQTLAVYSSLTSDEQAQLYELKDKSVEYRVIDSSFFTFDGHVSYDPARKKILYDSYPTEKEPYRSLLIYDLEKEKGRQLGRFYSDPKIDGDIRCDLHPRWSPEGSCITFDSIHEGFRGVYELSYI